ncbi:MAG: DNA starvation/stationary phase protection protein [Bacilli bacterium]|nr:DNA starvation/stationary phase protection protein [Bacilli bacterium]
MNNNYQQQINHYLNQFLSSIAVLTNNMYNYHWNLVGSNFFGLHSKFQEYYEKGSEEYDVIAERIKQLGGYPVTLSSYPGLSAIKEVESKSYNGSEAINNTINEFKTMHRLGSDIANYAETSGDGVTASIIGDYLTYLEKQLWMLEANMK